MGTARASILRRFGVNIIRRARRSNGSSLILEQRAALQGLKSRRQGSPIHYE
jgi:hypothetical protein